MSQKNVRLLQSGFDFGRKLVDTGLNWYDSHKALADRNARMPLLKHYSAIFSEPLTNSQGILYSNRRTRSFRTSLLKRDNPTLEWIDALFIYKDGQWYLHQNHVFLKGQLEAQEKILLPPSFLEEGLVALDILTPEGFPSSKISGSRYTLFCWPPKDQHVAVFYTDPEGSQLRFNEPPTYASSNRGSRPVYSLSPNLALEQRLSPTG